MEETRPVPDPVEDGWKFPGWLTAIVAVALVACVVIAFIVPPSTPEPGVAALPSASDVAGRSVLEIESAIEAYAAAHGGKFPEGKSSTEVFQKLLDGAFVKNPRSFYLETEGKTPAVSTQLRPENVSFDVTVPLDPASAGIPVVISTGFRIEYKPGGRAVPVPGRARPGICDTHILFATTGPHAFYEGMFKQDGIVTVQVIAPDAPVGPGPFTQLTPDGPLPAP